MCSSSREEVVEVLDGLRACVKRALDLTFDALTTPEQLNVLEGFEECGRQLPAAEHALINKLAREDPTTSGGKLAPVLADHCGSAGARRRGACTRPRIWVSVRR